MKTTALAPRPHGVEIASADCMDYLRSLDSDSVDLIATDPAYSGMNQHLRLGHGRIVGHYGKPNNDDWFQEFADDPQQFSTFLKECQRVLRDGRHIYIMFDTFSLLTLGAIVREHFGVKGVIVWDKMSMGMGNYFRRQHEFILFAAKGRRSINRRDITDVWTIRRLHKKIYPTQKPVALFQKMLDASAEPGYVVCDPFVGSGSSAIAAITRQCDFRGCDASATAARSARERVDAYLSTGLDPCESQNAKVIALPARR
jgi:site-specific DNA-methyltransferase (adenine-specific)